MNFNIEMPHVGESVTEAVIEKWLKQPGDRVEKYEPIVEVVTDKVAMEVPSPATGELTRIVAEEGDTVAMGAVIAEMNAEGVDEAPSAEPAGPPAVEPVRPDRLSTAHSTRAQAQVSQSAPSGLRIASSERVGSMITAANVGPTGGAFSDTSLVNATASRSDGGNQQGSQESSSGFARLSPAVRRLLDEHGLDAADITGTGVGGRITRADVLKAANEGAAKPDSPEAVAGHIEKPSAVRRMIAGHMTKSFREIPHAWSAIEVDVSGLVECRRINIEHVQQQTGVKLTYLPFALAVTASALRSNPLLNSSWREEGILVHDEINVGIAAAGKDGLVVPVVRNADAKSVLTLASELAGLVEKTRQGALGIEHVSDGTFTLNNTGALGSVWGGAIINHPQAAILTTEAIVKRPVVTNDDAVEIRSMMNLCLSFDHRVIDGAEASKFLQDVKSGLEAISAETELE